MTATEVQLGIDDFVAISAVLTGYSKAELFGTGCADEYWQQFRRVLPEQIRVEFLQHATRLDREQETDPQAVAEEIRSRYLSSERLGPVSRTLIQLWYLGQWVPLPPDWRRRFGTSRFDVSRVISVLAYKEGLVWDAIGAHPMGAKQQGFGAWALNPPEGGV